MGVRCAVSAFSGFSLRRRGALTAFARRPIIEVVEPKEALPTLEADALAEREAAGRRDLELSRRALAGDPEARDEFVRRMSCIPRVLGAINARTGRPLAPEELNDLCQEVFAVLWNKLSGFEGRAKLETWAGRFCLNLFRNALRSMVRRPRALEEPQAQALEEAEREIPMAQDETRALLDEALTQVPKNQARAIRLREYERLSFERIAHELDVPTATAKTWYYRGLERLRAVLRPRVGEGLS